MSANAMDTSSDSSGFRETTLPPRYGQKASATPIQASLKRARDQAHFSGLPPLPELNGDILLDVFTHKSIRFPGAPMNDDHGDGDRLATLGQKVADMITTNCLFHKRPMLKGEELESQRAEILSDANVDSWLSGYKLREKVRCSADAFPKLNTPEENEVLFNSYVGAVFYQKGYRAAQDWISRLIDPEADPPAYPEPFPETHSDIKRFKSETKSASPFPQQPPVVVHSIFTPPPPPLPEPEPPQSPPPPPPPPPESSPHVPPPPPLPVSSVPPSDSPMSYQPPPPPPAAVPTQAGMAYLPLFNQTASQRRVNVDWPAVFSGPSHAGMWSVRCIVNGVERGAGHGASKQLAKEDAAQQAFYAMGWGPRNAPTTSSSSSTSTSSYTASSLFSRPSIKQEPTEYSPVSSLSGSIPSSKPSSMTGFSSLSSQASELPSLFPNPLAPAQPNSPFLPLFNQTASQRRIPVDYPAEFTGPPHSGRWIVKCVVNGVLKGEGTGSSKQLAKEEAARQAFYAMGWAGAAH